MASSSKSNNMNKAIVFVALFGLLLGVLARSCVQVEEEINGSHFEQQFVVTVEIFATIVSSTFNLLLAILGSIYPIHLIDAR
ncbi:Protein C15H7.4 [Corchorus olitorius]|uniref:Protein C15H7.4 n=1 Tax=Corchorus olitorius TaxID=93759 RepID=A0A1R3GHN0_9ROSI|nr:Protein C15H7.4 [Corchorus olitorius]